MLALIVALVAAGVATLLAVHSPESSRRLALDSDLSSPQKFHARPVPRIGGIGIWVGMFAGTLAAAFGPAGSMKLGLTLLGCSLPAFVVGLWEDLTKNVSPRRRLVATAASAGLAIVAVSALITRTDIPGLDWVVGWTPAAVMVTVFAVAGVANAVNIIDGFNGLSSMCCMLMFAALAYVSYQAGDAVLGHLCLIGIGAVMGFFVWNFPAGLIFLGDGGAYFLGFWLAELSILLLARNPQVSPVFPLLLCIYPIFETLFSIYRKRFLRGMSPGVPDGVHLHMLVYKRLMRWAVGNKTARALTRRNSMTSPYLWVMCALSVAPAVLYWDRSAVLAVFIALFAATYVFLYWRIVRFNVPRWLVFRRP